MGVKCREGQPWVHPLCGRAAGLYFEANDAAHNAAGVVLIGGGGGGRMLVELDHDERARQVVGTAFIRRGDGGKKQSGAGNRGRE